MLHRTAAPAVVTWRVVPLRTPHVVRPCPRCSRSMPFASSDRFRVNASGRKLDVWLIYRCTGCELTWNLTVIERATPEAIGAARLAAFHRNDRELAWRCAFDGALLRRAGAAIEASTPVAVQRPPLPPGPVEIRLELPFPVRVRLDRLVRWQAEPPELRRGFAGDE